MDARTRKTTEDAFVVRRVQTMLEFFQLSETAGAAFRGTGPPLVLEDHRLYRPIRSFTAEFIRRIMLGVSSLSVATIICIVLQVVGIVLPGTIIRIKNDP